MSDWDVDGLSLDALRKIGCDALLPPRSGDLSITVMRGGAGQSFLDLLSAVRIGPEGVAQSHVIKALYPLGSPFKIAASAEWLCSIALSRSFRVI